MEHLQVVPESALDILATTTGTQFEASDGLNGDVEGAIIMAVISLVGDIEWSVFIGIPKDTAVGLVEKFAGFAVPFEDDDMGDAIGELTNVLVGDIKMRLDAKGVAVEISLPSVMRAESMKVLIGSQSHIKTTSFMSDMGNMWIGVVAGQSAGFVA